METPKEIEERLAGGGPSWDAVLRGVVAGATVAEELEAAGIGRMRYKAWLAENRGRGREVRLAEEVRDERLREEVKRRMWGLARDESGETPIKDRIVALDKLGKDLGVFKDSGMDRVADSLEAILGRVAEKSESPARLAQGRVVDEAEVVATPAPEGYAETEAPSEPVVKKEYNAEEDSL